MKRVVFSLSMFFLLFTLSTAFRVTKLDLTHATKLFDHDDHIESTDVPDHTGSQYYNILKNRFNPHRCRHHRHRHPVRFVTVRESDDNGEVQVVFPGEAKVLRHRHVARNFPGVEDDEQRMDDRLYMIPRYRLRHRHRHRHHRNDLDVEEDAKGVEVKEAVNEEEHKDDEHEDKGKHIFEKIGKFLGYF